MENIIYNELPEILYSVCLCDSGQEQKSLVHIGDSFKKIIVVKDRIKLWRNEEGIAVMGIMDFLLKPNSLEL